MLGRLLTTACASQAYTQEVWITNGFGSRVEVTVRAGSRERYTVTPATLKLEPGKSQKVVRRSSVAASAASAASAHAASRRPHGTATSA
jgi:hypothetical protein